jgi:hypothetical protein
VKGVNNLFLQNCDPKSLLKPDISGNEATLLGVMPKRQNQSQFELAK